MSRQLTINRTELGLTPLLLNDPDAGYWVLDSWKPGGVIWQRYTASSSPLVDGERVVAQRRTSVDEIVQVAVHASTPGGLKAKVATIAAALAQFRYTFTINWDGYQVTYTANGAGDMGWVEDQVDPVLHRAGWVVLELTIPRQP
jgi:hypothetical protein